FPTTSLFCLGTCALFSLPAGSLANPRRMSYYGSLAGEIDGANLLLIRSSRRTREWWPERRVSTSVIPLCDVSDFALCRFCRRPSSVHVCLLSLPWSFVKTGPRNPGLPAPLFRVVRRRERPL